MTSWTEAELADAARDAIAMVRASLDGRQDDVDTILNAAAETGVRPVGAIAATLLGMTADLYVRLTVASHLIGEGRELEWVTGERSHELAASDELRAAAAATLAATQARIITDSQQGG